MKKQWWSCQHRIYTVHTSVYRSSLRLEVEVLSGREVWKCIKLVAIRLLGIKVERVCVICKQS